MKSVATKSRAKRIPTPTTNGVHHKPSHSPVKKPAVSPVAEVCSKLQEVQKIRVALIKSRNMQLNRLRAIVAGSMGYTTAMEDADRKKMFQEADKVIKEIVNGTRLSEVADIVLPTMIGISAFLEKQADYDKQLLQYARKLHVAKWTNAEDQCGFGVKSLGIVIGETGDLFKYSSHKKVWRRMGCAPFTSSAGETKMGSTWRYGKEGKLSAEEWSSYGYSPRRRSIAYMVGESLIKANVELTKEKIATWTGPYRQRWLDAKMLAYQIHPDWSWSICLSCKKRGKGILKNCGTCGGMGKQCKRAHLHGMLLATKLLLKNLWIEWHK